MYMFMYILSMYSVHVGRWLYISMIRQLCRCLTLQWYMTYLLIHTCMLYIYMYIPQSQAHVSHRGACDSVKRCKGDFLSMSHNQIYIILHTLMMMMMMQFTFRSPIKVMNCKMLSIFTFSLTSQYLLIKPKVSPNKIYRCFYLPNRNKQMQTWLESIHQIEI